MNKFGDVMRGQVWQHKSNKSLCWYVASRTPLMATIRRCDADGGNVSMYDRDIRLSTLIRDHDLVSSTVTRSEKP